MILKLCYLTLSKDYPLIEIPNSLVAKKFSNKLLRSSAIAIDLRWLDLEVWGKRPRCLYTVGFQLTSTRKSQIAIEYAYRFREQFPPHWIFWVHAGNRARFCQAYEDIAVQAGLAGRDDPKVDVLRLVREWLGSGERSQPWLMVLDNADNGDIFFTDGKSAPTQGASPPEAFKPLSFYLPESRIGSILVTTRDRRVAVTLTNNSRRVIDVQPLEPADAKYLLFRKLPDDNSTDRAFGDLVEALDCLPLAITQAAAYIRMSGPRMTVSKYFEMLQFNESTQTRLLEKEIGDSRRDSTSLSSVIKTWRISFDQLKDRDTKSCQLLSLMSVLDRQGIPDFLLSPFFEDPLEFEDALCPLVDFSFVVARKGGTSFGMHSLVQLSMRRWLESCEELESWRGGSSAAFSPDISKRRV